MKNFASRTGISIAVSAAAMSIVSALFVPYAYPLPSLACAVVACAAAVWMASSSIRPTPRMSDVISELEVESPRVLAAPESGLVSTRVGS
jgi:hypothetical protein